MPQLVDGSHMEKGLRLYNQDLAGFFIGIDTNRFLHSWHMLLYLTTDKVNVHPDHYFSIHLQKTNRPGVNVTRKLRLGDSPALLIAALHMQTFTLGSLCYQQVQGSPMGPPLSPALCLMVVSL